jgi:hypothetical protein
MAGLFRGGTYDGIDNGGTIADLSNWGGTVTGDQDGIENTGSIGDLSNGDAITGATIAGIFNHDGGSIGGRQRDLRAEQ